jgi:hypothetical protein
VRHFLGMLGLCGFLTLTLNADEKKADKEKVPDGKFTCIDIQRKANSITKNQFQDSLAQKEQTLEGVKFKVGARFLQLGGTNLPSLPDKIEGIKVDRKFVKLHILHATGWSADDDTIIAEYIVTWEDDTSLTIPVVYGKDVMDWWYAEDTPDPTRGKVAWTGENDAAKTQGEKIHLGKSEARQEGQDHRLYDFQADTLCAVLCGAYCGREVKQQCPLTLKPAC